MTLIRTVGGFPNLWDGIVDSGAIANFQTIFNLLTAIVLVPFTGLLVKLSCAIVKDDAKQEDKYPELAVLDKKLMISPTLALQGVTKAATAMIKAARENVGLSLEQYASYDEEKSEYINRHEERLDKFTDDADNYLIQLSQSIETDKDNRQLNMLMQTIPNIERIGDYATNFDELALKLHETGSNFSEGAQKELRLLGDAIMEILRLTVEAIETDSDIVARRIEPLEEVIDDMVLLLRNRHTARLCQGVCSVNTGLIFMDSLTHLERAADQCSSIAMLLLGRHNDAILKNHHQYLHDLHSSTDQSYLAEQENRKQQYLAPLENIQY